MSRTRTTHAAALLSEPTADDPLTVTAGHAASLDPSAEPTCTDLAEVQEEEDGLPGLACPPEGFECICDKCTLTVTVRHGWIDQAGAECTLGRIFARYRSKDGSIGFVCHNCLRRHPWFSAALIEPGAQEHPDQHDAPAEDDRAAPADSCPRRRDAEPDGPGRTYQRKRIHGENRSNHLVHEKLVLGLRALVVDLKDFLDSPEASECECEDFCSYATGVYEMIRLLYGLLQCQAGSFPSLEKAERDGRAI